MIPQYNIDKNTILTIFGPTAAGKTEIAIKYAKNLNAIIINADSAQVYKQLPTLSNSPTQEEQEGIPHFLFNFLALNEEFSVGKWLNLVKKQVYEAFNNNQVPIIVGGSGMYISTLLEGISPIPSNLEQKQKAQDIYLNQGGEYFTQLIHKIDPNILDKFTDKQRLIRAYEVYLITGKSILELQKLPKQKTFPDTIKFENLYITKPREELYNKINSRFITMINEQSIHEMNIAKSQIPDIEKYLNKIIGAQEVYYFLQNKITKEEAITTGQQKTRHYAKRQTTWFNHQIKNYKLYKTI